MNKICLFGASGHGKVVQDIGLSIDIEVEVFIDDNPKTKYLNEIPVELPQEMLKYKNNDFIISIGNNNNRKIISERVKKTYTKLIHKTAIVSKEATVLEGTVVMAGVIINSGSFIGKHVIVNTASVIEHDCKIDDFVHVSPNATIAGNVEIGEGTHIGSGAIVIPNVVIGKWAVIGAGAVIIKDVPDYAVVVGNPGKIIKYNEK